MFTPSSSQASARARHVWHDRLSLLLDSTGEGIYGVDIEGRCTFINPAAARIFGQKDTGGRVEILIERLLPGNEARAQLGFSKPPRPGSRIALDAGGDVEVLGREDSFWHLRFHVGESLEQWLQF